MKEQIPFIIGGIVLIGVVAYALFQRHRANKIWAKFIEREKAHWAVDREIARQKGELDAKSIKDDPAMWADYLNKLKSGLRRRG